MNLARYISARFNSHSIQPRSVRLMRVVAIAGIAIALAALLIAASVGAGFEKEYRRALLNFNAHVIVMSGSEMYDDNSVRRALGEFVYSSDDDREFYARYSFILSWLDRVERLSLYHEGIADGLDSESWKFSLWRALDPKIFMSILPDRILSSIERLVVARTRGVEGMTPFIYREALAVGAGGIRGVVIKGVDPSSLASVNDMKMDLFDSALNISNVFENGAGKRARVIVGKALLAALGERDVSLFIVQADKGSGNAKKRFEEVEIAGTFETGMYDYDAQFMLMSMTDVRKIFALGKNAFTGMELKLDDPEKAEFVATAIEDELMPPANAVTWSELNNDLLAAVKMERIISAIIMGMMVAVASLNIIAVLVLMTIYRLAAISTLKAIGASQLLVRSVFVRGGVWIGTIGSILGIAAGLLISAAIGKFKLIHLDPEIYLISSLPVDIKPQICILMGLYCIFMSYLASWFVARKLSSLPISTGLNRARG